MYFLAALEQCPTELQGIFSFVNNLITLIKIAVPILLIVLGSLDLGKAVAAGDDKEIKAAQGMLIKRAVAAIMVFFISTFVALIMRLLTDNTWKNCLTLNDFNNTPIVMVEK